MVAFQRNTQFLPLPNVYGLPTLTRTVLQSGENVFVRARGTVEFADVEFDGKTGTQEPFKGMKR